MKSDSKLLVKVLGYYIFYEDETWVVELYMEMIKCNLREFIYEPKYESESDIHFSLNKNINLLIRFLLEANIFLEKQGYVHVDLAPRNIGVTWENQFVLLDLDSLLPLGIETFYGGSGFSYFEAPEFKKLVSENNLFFSTQKFLKGSLFSKGAIILQVIYMKSEETSRNVCSDFLDILEKKIKITDPSLYKILDNMLMKDPEDREDILTLYNEHFLPFFG